MFRSSVFRCSWFYSMPLKAGARTQARDLVNPLLVAGTTWFRMPAVCSAKGECVEHGIECHEIRDGINV